MATAFNLTAQLNLQGPSNIRQIVSDVKKQLGTISADVKFKIDPASINNTSKLSQALQSLDKNLASVAGNAQAASVAIKNFGQSVSTISSSSSKLSNNLAKTTKAADNLGKSVSKTAKSVSVTRTEMEEFGRQSALAIRRFAAFSAVTGVFFSLNRAINSGLKSFIEFDRQLVRLQQVTGKSAEGLKGLQDEISRLSIGLGVSSDNLIQVSSTLAQAGLSANETKVALEALAKSELAPSFDNINQTVEGSIALMRQFGISAKELEKALGSVNAVAAAFAVESGDIIAAIQRTGGVFASASRGVSEGTDALNEFIAVFTSVRATTRESAETIATGLRTIFTRIQRAGTIEALKEFGVTLTDAEGKFVGAYKAIELLSQGLNRIDPRDLRFSQIVEELGGFRQIGKVIPLIQQFATAQEALKVAQGGQGSLAADAAKAQLSLANQIAKVREEFLTLIRGLGQSDTFQTLAKGALGFASGLIKITSALKGVLPALAILGAGASLRGLTQFTGGFLGGLKKVPKGEGGEQQGIARSIGSNLGASLVGAKTEQVSRDLDQNSTALDKVSGKLDNLTSSLNSLNNNFNSINSTLNSYNSLLQQSIASLTSNTSSLDNLTNAINNFNPGGGPTTVRNGGKILGFNKGGVVPGSGKGDKVHAMLEPGEVVMSNSAVSKYGRGNLVRMNKYAKGGGPRSSLVQDVSYQSTYDGDSLIVDYTPKPEPYRTSTRLVGYDAYELNSGTSAERKKALQAKNITETWARKQGKNLLGKFEAASGKKDKYGRPMFDAPVLGKRLVDAGVAVPYDGTGDRATSKYLGGKIRKFMDGGIAQRKVGYIDYDVIANEANQAMVSKGMESTGVKGPRLYTDHLTQLAIQARKDSNLQKLRAVYGVAGSGKTTLARGQGTDKGKLRETTRFPILTPEDIQRASEVIILSSTVSKDKLDDVFSATDRTYTLSSTTAEEKERVKSQRGIRDTTGVGLEGRKPGSTTSVATDTAVGEALLSDRLGDRSVVLGRSNSGKLRRKRGDELVEVIKKKIGFTWGGYSPMTAGHESIMDAASAMGIPPEDFIYLVGSNEGIIPGKEDSYRTAIFDQDARMILAKAGVGAKGATVLRKPRDFEVPQAFDISEPEQRRKVIVPAKGSTTFVADKTPEETEKYKKAGYNVKHIERTGGISGTMVRKLIQDGNLGELQKVLSPGVYDLISNNIGRIQNRANIIPSLIQETQQTQGVKLADIEKQIKAVGITKIVKSKLDDPEYAAKAEVLTQLREKRDQIKSAASFEPHRLLAALAAKEPEKYGLDLEMPSIPDMKPIRTISSKQPQKANIGGIIQRFMAGSTDGVQESPLALPDDIISYLKPFGNVGDITRTKLMELLEENKLKSEQITADFARTKMMDVIIAQVEALGGIEPMKRLVGLAPGDRDLNSLLRKNAIGSTDSALEKQAEVVNKGLDAKGVKDAEYAARIAKMTKVGVVGLIGENGELDYSKTFDDWDIGNGRKVFATVKGLQSKYLDAYVRLQQDTREAKTRFQENLQYTDIFTGDPLVFDFDETLVTGADILTEDKKPDIPKYSDRTAVEQALSKAKLTRLGTKLKSLIEADPEFINQTRILTARPQSTADLLATKLQQLGLPYSPGYITGVSQDVGKGKAFSSVAQAKSANLGELEKLVDDNLENIQAAQESKRQTFLYRNPEALGPEYDEKFGQGNIEGSFLEAALAELGANLPPIDKLEQNRAVDFPNGLGPAAQFFGIDPTIPTEVKRRLNNDSFTRARAEFGRYYDENPDKFNIGGLVQRLMAGGKVGMQLGTGKGRSPKGPKGSKSPIEPISSETYLQWAKSIYQDYDNDPSLVMTTDELGIRMPPEIALANRLLTQYSLEKGGAGLSIGTQFVRTPKENITDDIRPYLVPDPSDPNELGFFKDDLRKFSRGIKTPLEVGEDQKRLDELNKRKNTSKMQRQLFRYALEGVAKSVRDKTLSEEQMDILSPDVLATLSKDPKSQVFSLPKLESENFTADAGSVKPKFIAWGKDRVGGDFREVVSGFEDQIRRGLGEPEKSRFESLLESGSLGAYIKAGGKDGHIPPLKKAIYQIIGVTSKSLGGLIQSFKRGGYSRSPSKLVPNDPTFERSSTSSSSLIDYTSALENSGLNLQSWLIDRLASDARTNGDTVDQLLERAKKVKAQTSAQKTQTDKASLAASLMPSGITQRQIDLANSLKEPSRFSMGGSSELEMKSRAVSALRGQQMTGAEMMKAAKIAGYEISERDDGMVEFVRGGRIMHTLSRKDASHMLGSMVGGTLARKNGGGYISGFANGGTVPALVSNGEAYVPPKIAKRIGYGQLNKMNQADKNGMGRFSSGGISVFKGPGSGTSDSIPTNLPVGSFIIREKATKALGLNKGGAVQRFANGGGPNKAPSGVSVDLFPGLDKPFSFLEKNIIQIANSFKKEDQLFSDTMRVFSSIPPGWGKLTDALDEYGSALENAGLVTYGQQNLMIRAYAKAIDNLIATGNVKAMIEGENELIKALQEAKDRISSNIEVTSSTTSPASPILPTTGAPTPPPVPKSAEQQLAAVQISALEQKSTAKEDVKSEYDLAFQNAASQDSKKFIQDEARAKYDAIKATIESSKASQEQAILQDLLAQKAKENSLSVKDYISSLQDEITTRALAIIEKDGGADPTQARQQAVAETIGAQRLQAFNIPELSSENDLVNTMSKLLEKTTSENNSLLEADKAKAAAAARAADELELLSLLASQSGVSLKAFKQNLEKELVSTFMTLKNEVPKLVGSVRVNIAQNRDKLTSSDDKVTEDATKSLGEDIRRAVGSSEVSGVSNEQIDKFIANLQDKLIKDPSMSFDDAIKSVDGLQDALNKASSEAQLQARAVEAVSASSGAAKNTLDEMAGSAIKAAKALDVSQKFNEKLKKLSLAIGTAGSLIQGGLQQFGGSENATAAVAGAVVSGATQTASAGLALAGQVNDPKLKGLILLGTAAMTVAGAFKDAHNALRNFNLEMSQKRLDQSLNRVSNLFDEFSKDSTKLDVLDRINKELSFGSKQLITNLQNDLTVPKAMWANMFDLGGGAESAGRSMILEKEGVMSYFKSLDFMGGGGEGGYRERSIQRLAPEKAVETAQKAQPQGQNILRQFENRLRTGENIDDILSELKVAGNETAEVLARMNPKINEQIMLIQNSTKLTEDEKKSRINSIMSIEAQRVATLNMKNSMKQLEFERLEKQINNFAASLERMFNGMEQAINKVSFDLDKLSRSAELSASALSGNAKAGDIMLDSINVLQNPRAYSGAEQGDAFDQAAGMFGSQAGLIRPLLGLGDKLESTVMKTINASVQANPNATTEGIAGKIRSALDKQLRDLGLPPNIADKLAGQTKEAFAKIRSKEDDTRLNFDQVVEEVPAFSKAISSAQRAQELANKAMEFYQKNVNEYAQAMNQMVDYQIEANSRMRKASEIQAKGNMELSRTLGKRISLDESRRVSEAPIRSMTGELTDARDIGRNVVNLENTRRAQQASVDSAANRGPAGKDEFMLMQNRLRGTNTALRENIDALKQMADSTDMAQAALSKIQEVQQRRQAGANLIEKMVTSSPEELARLNASIGRLNNNMRGGLNVGSTSEQRGETLQTFNMIAPLLGDGQQQNELRANVLESMLKESGLGIDSTLQGVIDSLRDPEGDPQMAEAISVYRESLARQSEANTVLAELQSLMSANTAEIAAQKIATSISGVTLTFDQQIMDDMRNKIQVLIDVVKGRVADGKDPIPAAGKNRGGIIYASMGQAIDFAPKGTDTVPAMLTPGEFVVNRAATQANLPLLQSINNGYSKGGKVKYYQDGGAVSISGSLSKYENTGQAMQDFDAKQDKKATFETKRRTRDPLIKIPEDIGNDFISLYGVNRNYFAGSAIENSSIGGINEVGQIPGSQSILGVSYDNVEYEKSLVADLAQGTALLTGAVAGAGTAMVANAGVKAAKQWATKKLAGEGLKQFTKLALKSIPGVGLLTGVALAAYEISRGNYIGALAEVGSGAASMIPGVGTALSMAISAGGAVAGAAATSIATDTWRPEQIWDTKVTKNNIDPPNIFSPKPLGKILSQEYISSLMSGKSIEKDHVNENDIENYKKMLENAKTMLIKATPNDNIKVNSKPIKLTPKATIKSSGDKIPKSGEPHLDSEGKFKNVTNLKLSGLTAKDNVGFAGVIGVPPGSTLSELIEVKSSESPYGIRSPGGANRLNPWNQGATIATGYKSITDPKDAGKLTKNLQAAVGAGVAESEKLIPINILNDRKTTSDNIIKQIDDTIKDINTGKIIFEETAESSANKKAVSELEALYNNKIYSLQLNKDKIKIPDGAEEPLTFFQIPDTKWIDDYKNYAEKYNDDKNKTFSYDKDSFLQLTPVNGGDTKLFPWKANNFKIDDSLTPDESVQQSQFQTTRTKNFTITPATIDNNKFKFTYSSIKGPYLNPTSKNFSDSPQKEYGIIQPGGDPTWNPFAELSKPLFFNGNIDNLLNALQTFIPDNHATRPDPENITPYKVALNKNIAGFIKPVSSIENFASLQGNEAYKVLDDVEKASIVLSNDGTTPLTDLIPEFTLEKYTEARKQRIIQAQLNKAKENVGKATGARFEKLSTAESAFTSSSRLKIAQAVQRLASGALSNYGIGIPNISKIEDVGGVAGYLMNYLSKMDNRSIQWAETNAWRGLFSELFQPKNPEAAAAYLKGFGVNIEQGTIDETGIKNIIAREKAIAIGKNVSGDIPENDLKNLDLETTKTKLYTVGADGKKTEIRPENIQNPKTVKDVEKIALAPENLFENSEKRQSYLKVLSDYFTKNNLTEFSGAVNSLKTWYGAQDSLLNASLTPPQLDNSLNLINAGEVDSVKIIESKSDYDPANLLLTGEKYGSLPSKNRMIDLIKVRKEEAKTEEKQQQAVDPGNFANGGLVYASNGTLVNYQPRGTDTVPAMLTPGEFVINRDSTNKYRPVLEAINNGSYSRGGIVNYLKQGGYIVPKYLDNGGVASGSSSGRSFDFTKYMSGLTNSLISSITTAFDKALSNIKQPNNVSNGVSNNNADLASIDNFVNRLNNIANILSNIYIPPQITITGKHDVVVTINGDTVLNQLRPDIAGIVVSAIRGAFADLKAKNPENNTINFDIDINANRFAGNA